MMTRLGNPQPFLTEGDPLSEQAQLGMAQSEPRTVTHGGHEDLTEALAVPCPVEDCCGLPVAVDRPTIVALGHVCSAEVGVRQCLPAALSAGGGEGEGPLGGGDGLVMLRTCIEMD